MFRAGPTFCALNTGPIPFIEPLREYIWRASWCPQPLVQFLVFDLFSFLECWFSISACPAFIYPSWHEIHDIQSMWLSGNFCSLFPCIVLSSGGTFLSVMRHLQSLPLHSLLSTSSFLGSFLDYFYEKRCRWDIGCGRKVTLQLKKEHLYGRRMDVWFNEPGGRQQGRYNGPF